MGAPASGGRRDATRSARPAVSTWPVQGQPAAENHCPFPWMGALQPQQAHACACRSPPVADRPGALRNDPHHPSPPSRTPRPPAPLPACAAAGSRGIGAASNKALWCIHTRAPRADPPPRRARDLRSNSPRQRTAVATPPRAPACAPHPHAPAPRQRAGPAITWRARPRGRGLAPALSCPRPAAHRDPTPPARGAPRRWRPQRRCCLTPLPSWSALSRWESSSAPCSTLRVM